MKTAVVLLGMVAVALASIFSPDDHVDSDNMLFSEPLSTAQLVKQFVNKFVHEHPRYSADSCIDRCYDLVDMINPQNWRVVHALCHSECIRAVMAAHAQSTTTAAT